MAGFQLRRYKVKEGQLEAFVEVFRRVVVARSHFGFTVMGPWTEQDTGRFVWILRHDGPGSFEDAAAAYYDSDERKAIHPEPSSFLDEVETHMLRAID